MWTHFYNRHIPCVSVALCVSRNLVHWALPHWFILVERDKLPSRDFLFPVGFSTKGCPPCFRHQVPQTYLLSKNIPPSTPPGWPALFWTYPGFPILLPPLISAAFWTPAYPLPLFSITKACWLHFLNLFEKLVPTSFFLLPDPRSDDWSLTRTPVGISILESLFLQQFLEVQLPHDLSKMPI